jgi:hypothetical protein
MAEDKRRTYSSETLALPPLQMVLVHAENERQNAAARPVLEPAEITEKRRKRKLVRKLIEHLEHKA